MDRDSEEVLSHLRAENEFLAQAMSQLKGLENELFDEIKSRIEETDISVPTLHYGWWYFERTREGLNYPIFSRVHATGGDLTPPEVDPASTLNGEQVVLDENVEAGESDYLSVGVLDVSPDGTWVAVGTDFDGDELHHVSVRPLAGQDPIDDELSDVYYGFAWAKDSRHFFYTRVDEAQRPYQLWRHELGTDPASDVLVLQEDDAQFNVSVGRSRDDAVIVVQLGSSMTTEVHFLDANNPTAPLTLLEGRRSGIEYGVEHYVDDAGVAWWLKVTNEGATDFRLLARRVDGDEWREVIAERPGSRLDGIDAFKTFFAISERHDGCASVRYVTAARGDDPFDGLLERSIVIEGPTSPSTVALSANPNFETTQLRVVITSLVNPRFVADVVIATGEILVRKQQKVLGGYDESNYVTGRLWVYASDGERSPYRSSLEGTSSRVTVTSYARRRRHRSSYTGMGATRSRSIPASRRCDFRYWTGASSSRSRISAAAVRWDAPGTRWASCPRNQRPSVTSCRWPERSYARAGRHRDNSPFEAVRPVAS